MTSGTPSPPAGGRDIANQHTQRTCLAPKNATLVHCPPYYSIAELTLLNYFPALLPPLKRARLQLQYKTPYQPIRASHHASFLSVL